MFSPVWALAHRAVLPLLITLGSMTCIQLTTSCIVVVVFLEAVGRGVHLVGCVVFKPLSASCSLLFALTPFMHCVSPVQLSEVPGFLLAMLRVITAEGVPVEVLLQAGIQFKNIVARGWQNMPDHPSLWPETEKAPIREIVIEVPTSRDAMPIGRMHLCLHGLFFCGSLPTPHYRRP